MSSRPPDSPHGALAAWARAILADSRQRRNWMFNCIVTAAAMTVLGGTLLFGWLRANPWLFLGYWLVCAWLTLLAALLAILDLLVLRHQSRRLERELRARLKAEAAVNEERSP